MKKLKIILPIFLISLFLFIGNVNADTIEVPVHYSQVVYTKLENYSLLFDNAIQYLKDNATIIDNLDTNNRINLTNDENVVGFDLTYSNVITNELHVYIYYYVNDISYNSSYRAYRMNPANYFRINLAFDSSYNITGINSSSSITSSIDIAPRDNADGGLYENFYIDYRLGKNSDIIITNNASNNATFLIGSDSYSLEKNSSINFYDFAQQLDSDLITSPTPTIQPPYNIYKNGYTETTFLINNYTEESNVNGYFIRIINNNNGNVQNIAPDYENPDREITLTSYENTNYTFQLYDREHNIIEEYSINANVIYENNTNFSIDITNIDNSTREVFYKYIISDSNQNYTCYHSINNNPFIEDPDCMDQSTVYYNLTMPNNGNLAFKIEDTNNNIVYEYNQNFVFRVSDIYISFQDNYDNNYLNLNVLINRYQTNDIVEYSINNSSFMQANLEEYSSIQGIKNFYVNNLNNNDILNVRVKRNNEIITYARYKANYLKYQNNSEEDYNISNIFEKINIENINNELKEYIKNFGNLIINSKIGNLLLLQTFCLVIILIIKMIRN